VNVPAIFSSGSLEPLKKSLRIFSSAGFTSLNSGVQFLAVTHRLAPLWLTSSLDLDTPLMPPYVAPVLKAPATPSSFSQSSIPLTMSLLVDGKAITSFTYSDTPSTLLSVHVVHCSRCVFGSIFSVWLPDPFLLSALHLPLTSNVVVGRNWAAYYRDPRSPVSFPQNYAHRCRISSASRRFAGSKSHV
jgi:hypothetical protein